MAVTTSRRLSPRTGCAGGGGRRSGIASEFKRDRCSGGFRQINAPHAFFQRCNWRVTFAKRGYGTPKTVLTNTEVVAGRCWSASPGPPAPPFPPGLGGERGFFFPLAELRGPTPAGEGRQGS